MNTTASAAAIPADALIRGVTEIAAAFLANHAMNASDVPAFLRGISRELTAIAADQPTASLSAPADALALEAPATETSLPLAVVEASEEDRWAHLSKVPAVAIADSVTEDAVICLFDGEPKKMLKRYIRAKYGMEEADYKAFWNLPADYPMVAPGYARMKADVALAQGLGSTIDKTPRHLRLVGKEAIAA